MCKINNYINYAKTELKELKFQIKSPTFCDMGKRNNNVTNNINISICDKGENVAYENLEYKKLFDVNKLANLLYTKTLKSVTELYADSSLARNKVESFINMHKEIVSEYSAIHSHVLNRLKSLGDSDESYKNIADALNCTKNAFCGLETEYLRFKKLVNIGVLIPPTKQKIGIKYVPSTSKHLNIIESHEEVYAKFIPLRQVLKCVFEIKGVFQTVMTYKEKLENKNHILSNFIQGTLWKNLIREYRTKLVIPLLLFFNDYETGNALGVHAGMYKVGASYISTPLFPPEV